MKNTISFWQIHTFTLFLIVLPLYVSGQETTPLSEEDYFADIPVVLTATRLAQPINEAPASMTIIDRQLIEASGARNIVDVFKLVPGFQVQHENGHTPIVTYHGISDQFSRLLQVLVDGRTIYNASTGGVEWSQLPLVLDEIERIEVTRGPNAASFGSNAFAAVINIITKHASETTGTFFRLTAGNPNNVRDAILRYGESTGNLDYRIMLGRLTDEGFSDRYDISRATLGRLRVDYSATAKDTWLFETGFNNGPRGLDFSDNTTFPERNRERDTENSFQQLRWTHNLSNIEEFQIQYFQNFHKVDETNTYDLTADEFGLSGAPPFVIAAYNADPVNYALFNSLRTRRHDLEAQHTLIPNEDLRIVWGGSVRRDQWYSPGLISSDSTVEIDLSRVFANSEWHATDNFKINAGAMWENSEISGSSLSPRLGLVYHLDENNIVRAITSKATRIPTMIEYDGEIIVHYTGQNLTAIAGWPDPSLDSFLRGTKNLKHETIQSVEIGLHSLQSDVGLSTDIKIYRDKITDTIYFGTGIDPLTDIPITPLMAVPKNGEDITIQGIEIQANIKPGPGDRVFFSYAYTDIISDDINQGYSNSAPEKSISFIYSHQFKNNIDSSFSFYRSTEYEGLGSGNPINAQSRADIRIAYSFEKNDFGGKIAFTSQNITGQQYFDWSENNHYRRRYILSFTGQFN